MSDQRSASRPPATPTMLHPSPITGSGAGPSCQWTPSSAVVSYRCGVRTSRRSARPSIWAPTGALSYVARGEAGRVSQLTNEAGVRAVKEVELFVPSVDEADANVDLQESMLDAGLSLPGPRRTLDGHGLSGNV